MQLNIELTSKDFCMLCFLISTKINDLFTDIFTLQNDPDEKECVEYMKTLETIEEKVLNDRII